jgi:hypothetical protein
MPGRMPDNRQGSKTGSKRAAIAGYMERYPATEPAGRATSSHIQLQKSFIWHARGQGFESPKLHVSAVQRLIAIFANDL